VVTDPGLVLLSLLAAVGVGVLASYGLYALLVNGGPLPEWLEDNGWVYPAVLALGCARSPLWARRWRSWRRRATSG
jgi:hypothetical protein